MSSRHAVKSVKLSTDFKREAETVKTKNISCCLRPHVRNKVQIPPLDASVSVGTLPYLTFLASVLALVLPF